MFKGSWLGSFLSQLTALAFLVYAVVIVTVVFAVARAQMPFELAEKVVLFASVPFGTIFSAYLTARGTTKKPEEPAP